MHISTTNAFLICVQSEGKNSQKTQVQKFSGINSGGYEGLRFFSFKFQLHPEMIRMEDAILMINRLCIHIHTTKNRS
jgi:hypothetical protein